MAMRNPKGRVNYEPNSWDGVVGGPREAPETGFPQLSLHRMMARRCASAALSSPITSARRGNSI
jgi:hypothetical protein